MLTLSAPPTEAAPTRKRLVIKATRPSLIDLRFKGDPWIMDSDDGSACLYLGDYAMLRIDVTPFDVPSLNSTFQHVRLGQARWLQATRKSKRTT